MSKIFYLLWHPIVSSSGHKLWRVKTQGNKAFNLNLSRPLRQPSSSELRKYDVLLTPITTPFGSLRLPAKLELSVDQHPVPSLPDTHPTNYVSQPTSLADTSKWNLSPTSSSKSQIILKNLPPVTHIDNWKLYYVIKDEFFGPEI